MYLSDSSAVLTFDSIFTWYSKIVSTECKCHLKIYKIGLTRFVVIVSDLPINLAFNMAEEVLVLIQLISIEFNLKPTGAMWIKYYSLKSFSLFFKNQEIYEQLTLFQEGVYLEIISKQKIENLLGVELKS